MLKTELLPVDGLFAGDLLIVAGEVVHAFQVIIEQKLLNSEDKTKDVPALLAVGLEGALVLLDQNTRLKFRERKTE